MLSGAALQDNIRIYGDNMPVHIQGSVAVSPGSLIRPTARSLAVSVCYKDRILHILACIALSVCD